MTMAFLAFVGRTISLSLQVYSSSEVRLPSAKTGTRKHNNVGTTMTIKLYGHFRSQNKGINDMDKKWKAKMRNCVDFNSATKQLQ